MIPSNNSYYSSTSSPHRLSHCRPRVRNDRLLHQTIQFRRNPNLLMTRMIRNTLMSWSLNLAMPLPIAIDTLRGQKIATWKIRRRGGGVILRAKWLFVYQRWAKRSKTSMRGREGTRWRRLIMNKRRGRESERPSWRSSDREKSSSNFLRRVLDEVWNIRQSMLVIQYRMQSHVRSGSHYPALGCWTLLALIFYRGIAHFLMKSWQEAQHSNPSFGWFANRFATWFIHWIAHWLL